MIQVTNNGKLINVSYLTQEFITGFTQDKVEQLTKISEESTQVKTKVDLQKLLDEVKIICTTDFKSQVSQISPELFVNRITNQVFLQVDGKLSQYPLPESLVNRIKESIDKKVDYSPLIKCWTRFISSEVLTKKMTIGKEVGNKFIQNFSDYINKKYVVPHLRDKMMEEEGISFDLASELATIYEVKITQEGLLQVFKTSKEIDYKFEERENEEIVKVPRYSKSFDINTGEVTGDSRDDIPAEQRLFEPFIQGKNGDPFYCEGPNGFTKPDHFIRIGHLHRLGSWDQVNINDSETCVKGLHVGALSYITNWGNETTDIHCVFVDPAKIGAICKYSGDSAIRVIEYFVYESLMGLNQAIYHSSSYGKKCDEDMKQLLLKAVNN